VMRTRDKLRSIQRWMSTSMYKLSECCVLQSPRCRVELSTGAPSRPLYTCWMLLGSSCCSERLQRRRSNWLHGARAARHDDLLSSFM